MIKVQNLIFDYPNKRVLHDVSFALAKGSVTALVGPNGAGKTTLLRCIAALEKPYSGKITIAGLDVEDSPREVHGICGYLSDFFGLYDTLTVRQCLTYTAWCHKITGAAVQTRIAEIAAQVNIADMLDKPAAVLSRGYRQRLGIGLALIPDPQVLILDEPASGMDPDARIGLSHLIKTLRSQEKTIIVSSHILNELEEYCTEMLVIRDGRVFDQVTLKEHNEKAVRVLHIGITGLTAAQVEFVRAQNFVGDVQVSDEMLTCHFSGTLADQQKLLQSLMGQGMSVFSFNAAAQTLQDTYMNVTHRKATP